MTVPLPWRLRIAARAFMAVFRGHFRFTVDAEDSIDDGWLAKRVTKRWLMVEY